MINNRNLMIGSALLLALFMQINWAIPSPVPTNQLFMMASAALVLMRVSQDGMKLHWQSAALLVAMVLSIVCNDIPAFFKPWSRMFQFTLVIIGGSPLLSGKTIDTMRRQMTMGVLWAAAVITGLSFVGYFLGFGQYIVGGINGYMGVTGHPNFLGMYVLVTMICCAALFFRCDNMRERAIVAGAWGACLITLLVSASRGATAAGLVGSVIVAYLRLRKSASAVMTAVMVGVVAVILAMPYLLPYMETMNKKDVNNEDLEASVMSTRGFLWGLRMLEFEKSPIVGLGAYSCDTTLPSADIFYSSTNGSIELGSSYLGMLSQTGALGFLAFLAILLPICWKCYKYATVQRTPYAQLMFGLLVGILAHMLFEGYVETAGAVQCVIFWFVVGAAYQCDKVADYPLFWEKEEPITPEQYVYWRDHLADDGKVR